MVKLHLREQCTNLFYVCVVCVYHVKIFSRHQRWGTHLKARSLMTHQTQLLSIGISIGDAGYVFTWYQIQKIRSITPFIFRPSCVVVTSNYRNA